MSSLVGGVFAERKKISGKCFAFPALQLRLSTKDDDGLCWPLDGPTEEKKVAEKSPSLKGRKTNVANIINKF